MFNLVEQRSEQRNKIVILLKKDQPRELLSAKLIAAADCISQWCVPHGADYKARVAIVFPLWACVAAD